MKPLAYFGLGVVATIGIIKFWQFYDKKATKLPRKEGIEGKENKIEPDKK